MKEVLRGRTYIFVDGSAHPNPGKGGWGIVYIKRLNAKIVRTKHVAGDTGCSMVTNQQMEIYACVAALRGLSTASDVTIFTDSSLIVNAINKGWLETWIRNGWRKSNRKPVENQNYWERLLWEVRKHNVTFIKVTGHSGKRDGNSIADQLARGELKPSNGYIDYEFPE